MRVMMGSRARPSRNAQTVQAPAAVSCQTPDNCMPRSRALWYMQHRLIVKASPCQFLQTWTTNLAGHNHT